MFYASFKGVILWVLVWGFSRLVGGLYGMVELCVIIDLSVLDVTTVTGYIKPATAAALALPLAVVPLLFIRWSVWRCF